MNDIIIGRSASDREKYGDKGVIYLGKHYIKMGRTNSLSNKVFLDVLRSHVVFICGKRGGGKCLTGDSLITLGDGTIKRIDSLKDNKEQILSLDKDLKLKLKKPLNFYEREVKTTYKITLRSGKEIQLTPEHPLLTFSGWKAAETLKIGSRIATPRVSPVFGDSNLEEDKIKILAYLISEGHLGNNFILFSNNDKKIMQEFYSCIKNFDESLLIKNHGPSTVRVISENKRKITVHSKRNTKTGQFTTAPKFDGKNKLRKLLEELNLYNKKSEKKFIPEIIFKLTKQKLSIFLNRLFSCDGSIYTDAGWHLSYSSVSKRLIHEVQHLLLRFGVVSKLRTKKTKSSLGIAYELVISGEFVKIFLSEIGFYGIKEFRQTKALKEAITIKRNPNLDTIPKEFWDTYKPDNWADLGRAFNYKHPKAMRESVKYSVSRQKLLQIANYEQNQELLLMAESDIFWDEIISMKKIDEPTKVYDFTVPSSHNFVANDVIVHNSYSMGVIAEGISDLPENIKQNISIILVDTMGVYWTMKYPNKADKDILDEWDIDAKKLDVKIFTPKKYHDKFKEEGIPTDFGFGIKPSELSSRDWLTTFDIKPESRLGVLIEKTVNELSEKGTDYTLQDLQKTVVKDEDSEEHIKSAAKNLFKNAEQWGLFDNKGTNISDIAIPGQVSVLDISCYATAPGSWNIKNLVVGLVAEKLFIQRMTARKEEEFKDVHKANNPYSDEAVSKQQFPLVWLVIDEAHEFLPVKGKTLATEPLVTILREGRQPGISLILASQQPGKIHTDVMTQSDTVLAHRITAKLDTEALGTLMQSYMRQGLVSELDNLPREKGAAIIFDDTNEKMYPIRVRPRFTWHGGSAPSALKKE